MKRVYLEITNACNLDCPFCTYEKGNRFLSYEQICSYILQIKPFCNYIYLHILGEPLLHPDFEKILSFLDENHMQLQLISNGLLLKQYPNLLNHRCLRKLSISLHSLYHLKVEPEYFETINQILAEKTDTVIELRFYGMIPEGQIKEYYNQLVSSYQCKASRNHSIQLKDNVYLRKEEFFQWPDIHDDVISYQGYCHGAIDMIAINSNSDVTICCLDPNAYNRIGNLQNQKKGLQRHSAYGETQGLDAAYP